MVRESAGGSGAAGKVPFLCWECALLKVGPPCPFFLPASLIIKCIFTQIIIDNGGDIANGASNFPLRSNKGTMWEGAIRSAAFVGGALVKTGGRVTKGTKS